MCRQHVAKIEKLIQEHKDECHQCSWADLGADAEDTRRWWCQTGALLVKGIHEAEKHDRGEDPGGTLHERLVHFRPENGDYVE